MDLKGLSGSYTIEIAEMKPISVEEQEEVRRYLARLKELNVLRVIKAKRQSPKEAFKHVADFAAGETHKRQYSREELKKLSEALILLHEFFEKYEEEER
ncbi:hypothetical protein ACHAL6_00725 [Proteiniclasticum sp. C24MP]|uniref:hypothetical protein n=1 Tax=Proteiniclasticum sp. C24MP TaxID=3374101 RepID=UPI003753F8F8